MCKKKLIVEQIKMICSLAGVPVSQLIYFQENMQKSLGCSVDLIYALNGKAVGSFEF